MTSRAVSQGDLCFKVKDMAVAVFDLDGTIYFERQLAEHICTAVEQWRRAGHLAVIATGKSPAGVRDALDGTPLQYDYVIASTGAALYDATGGYLHHSSIPTDCVRDLVDLAQGLSDVAVFACTLESRDLRLYDSTTDSHNFVLDDFIDVDIVDLPRHTVTQVPFWVPHDEAKLQLLFDKISSVPTITPVRNQDFIDIAPKGISKGAGLQWLIDHLGLHEQPIFTFGDSWNDLTMHALAHRSFSLPWSPAEVKQATDEVVDSVSDALGELLNQLP